MSNTTDTYERGTAYIDSCLQAIMEWREACWRGKADAVANAVRLYDVMPTTEGGVFAILEYIDSRWPHCTERWAAAAGFEKKPEPEEVRPHRGDVYRTTYGSGPLYRFCLGSSQYNEEPFAGIKMVKETNNSEDWVAFIDCDEEGRITGSHLRWDPVDALKRNYTKVREIR